MQRVSKPEFLAEVIEKGKMIEDHMKKLMQEVSIIGDIRSKGLMLGIEFIDPYGQPDHLGSYPQSGVIAAKVQKECFLNHLIMEKGGRYGSVMRCLCALNVTKDDVKLMLDISEKAIRKVDADVKAHH